MKKLLLLALLASSTSSLAQGAPAPASPDEPKVEVRYRARTVIEIGPVDIQGAVKGPVGDIYVARKKVGFRNLIELRSNFRPELAVSGSHL